MESSYKTYKKVKICSNIIGAKYLLEIGNYHPLIITEGCDGLPNVSLYIKRQGIIIPIIENNKPTNKNFFYVDRDEKKGITEYKIRENASVEWNNLLIIKDSTDGGIPEVTNLDLRYIGLNVKGDSNSLEIGGATFKGNIVEGCNTFIKVE